MSTRGNGFFVSLLAFLFVVLVGIAVTGYALGWLTIEQEPQRTTIEIDTKKIENAADEAKQRGAELIEKTGETLHESGQSLEESIDQPQAN